MLDKIFQQPFKKQLLWLFLPVIIISLLIIGLFAYVFETANIRKNADSLIESTVRQAAQLIDDKLMTLFSQMISLSNSAAVNSLMINDYADPNAAGSFADILDCYKDMEEIYRNYDQIVDSLYFCNNKGTEVKYFTSDVPRHIGLSLSEWMETYTGSDQGIYWRNTHENEVFETTIPHEVLSVFRIIGTPQSKASGIMLFNLNSSYFQNLLDQANITENGYMLLLSQDGVLRSATAQNQYALTLSALERLREELGTSGMLNLRSVTKQSVIVTYHTIDVNGWMVAAVVPQNDLFSTAGQFTGILVVLLTVTILLVIFLANRMAKSISQPIEYLSNQVIRFDSGDMDVDFTIEADNEMGVLSHGLSYLKQAVIELMDQVKKEQQQQAKMQLLAMQEQIKPHFLYNTIGSIKHLVEMGQDQMASEMCVALAKFYRFGISGGREIVPLSEEVEHVRNYLQIQRMRYEKDFEYDIDIDDKIANTEVLKLSIQPLVENAIYHGIKTKEGIGTIVISGEKIGDHIEIRVFDDGVGMTPEQLEELRYSLTLPREVDHMRNFGLRNVNLRLRLHFGPGAGLKFESVKDVYTQVSIVIPLKNQEDKEEFHA